MDTPYDFPVTRRDEKTFPELREAYLKGRLHERAENPVPIPAPHESVYEPGVDNGWLIVQIEVEEEINCLGGPQAVRATWENLAIFEATEIREARDCADTEYQKYDGTRRVRVIPTGTAVEQKV